MPLHVGKGRNISTAIADIIDYVENPQKTDFGKFIYGYECDTRLADAEFLLSKRQYANLTGRNQGALPGLAWLMIAFLISPYGLPLAAAWLVGIIGGANSALKDFIFG
nr:CD1845 family protein [Faecalibacterium prausnitzii]